MWVKLLPMSMLPIHRLMTLAAACLPCAWACAQSSEGEPVPVSKSSYVLGGDISAAPEYAGSNRRTVKLRPIWAYQYGRFRFSTPGAGGVLSFGGGPDERGAGASTELVSSARLKLGVALRFDGGRPSSDSADLEGLPDIRRTLRGRIYTSYALDDNWGLGATLSQDLLGRQGGATLGVDIGYHHKLSERSVWSAGGGVGFADKRYMQTYYGITDRDAARTGLSTYSPGAGLRQAQVGVGFMTALTPRWVVFGGAGLSRLLGDAAASPITKSASTNSVHLGLAYRCCR